MVDDLIATGGTLEAGVKLIKQLGGNLVGISVLIELEGLDGEPGETASGSCGSSLLTRDPRLYDVVTRHLLASLPVQALAADAGVEEVQEH